MAPASGSDGRPRHGKGKGLTGSLMSVMSKFAGSRNKRPDVVRDVSAPMQKRKKVKPSDWEQTEVAEGGPVDPELIPSYGGHVAGRIWRGQIFIFMLNCHFCINRYVNPGNAFLKGNGTGGESGLTTVDKLDLPLLRPLALLLPLRGGLPLPRGLGLDPEPEPLPNPEPEPLDFPIFRWAIETYSK
ncbi:hypothetical protein M9H77_30871 [Catharanthus roseus]|uniref:Uncharacterized protein n=1 Tax=Catharanthus roseus TaxID=4058 RepID=A0ACC0A0I8_CATRO|nr:hypothetical protein M9H77_30871 [Catharanthus roseus]